MKLLNINNNAKTVKGNSKGYRTAILYMQPTLKTCPFSTLGCRQGCLVTAGRGAFKGVQKARAEKTKMYFEEREKFYKQLRKELISHLTYCLRSGKECCVRLNGTSDINWDLTKLPANGIIYYDYTKNFWKVIKNKQKNYHLTFSRHENTKWWHLWLLKILGKNSAVVFRKGLPKRYKGIRVVNGDETDLRFLDAKGVIVGLKAKGKAKKDTTGFVVG